MEKICLIIATIGLSLIGATLRAESNSEESQVVTIVINDDSEEAKGLKYTLEIYPTEIYFGDVVYFASYIENVSDEVRKPRSLLIGNPVYFANSCVVTCWLAKLAIGGSSVMPGSVVMSVVVDWK